MRIDPSTLMTVAHNFFARYDATMQTQARADLAFEAVGMLRAFVEGYEAEEVTQRQYHEATADLTADEDPF